MTLESVVAYRRMFIWRPQAFSWYTVGPGTPFSGGGGDADPGSAGDGAGDDGGGAGEDGTGAGGAGDGGTAGVGGT